MRLVIRALVSTTPFSQHPDFNDEQRRLALAAETLAVPVPIKGTNQGLETHLIRPDGTVDPAVYVQILKVLSFVTEKGLGIDPDISISEAVRSGQRFQKLEELDTQGGGRAERFWLRGVIEATKRPSVERQVFQRVVALVILGVLVKWTVEDGSRTVEAASEIPQLVQNLASAKIDILGTIQRVNLAGVAKLFEYNLPAAPDATFDTSRILDLTYLGDYLGKLAGYPAAVVKSIIDQFPEALTKAWEATAGPAIQAYQAKIDAAAQLLIEKFAYTAEEAKKTAIFATGAFLDSLLFPFWRKIVMNSAPVVRIANFVDRTEAFFQRIRTGKS